MGVFSVNDGKFMHRDSAHFHIAGAEANTMIGLSKLRIYFFTIYLCYR